VSISCKSLVDKVTAQADEAEPEAAGLEHELDDLGGHIKATVFEDLAELVRHGLVH
jgi:hypothetical protein